MFITKPAQTLLRITALTIVLTIFAANPTFGYAQVLRSEKVEAVEKKVETAPYAAEAIVSKVNEARVDEGLRPLTTNSELTLAAQDKANHMASNKYFGHWSPDGSTPWDFMEEAGYDYQNAGENLAVHFFETDTMVEAWLNSPAHRANIMDAKFSETGVGIVYGEKDGEKGWMVVQMFGTEF